jgi:uncharacterized membrane protein
VWEGGSVPVDARRATAGALAGFLGVAGLAHFLAPTFYEPLIPHALPGSPRGWVLVSGAAELACAAAVAGKRSRRLGATLAAILFVAVFPANVQMAVDWTHEGALKAVLGWARLPLQVPLIWWALRVRRQEVSRQGDLDQHGALTPT